MGKKKKESGKPWWGKLENTHKGCKLSIPKFKFNAIVPVINGGRALPPAPKAAIYPTVPFTR